VADGTLGGIVLGTLEAALGGLLPLSDEVDPHVLWWVAAAWGVASGTLLIAEGYACAVSPAPSSRDSRSPTARNPGVSSRRSRT
jgi:hypothetical protein